MSRLNLSGRRRLPLVLQSETAECALACLAMVAAWFGHHEDLGALRQRFVPGARGTTLNGIMASAEQLGLASRAVRCELDEAASLSLPAVLHWDFNHYVVLRSISRGSAIIHDPASGIRRLSLNTIGEHFTGVAIEFSPAEDFEKTQGRPRSGLLSYLGGTGSLAGPLSQLFVLSAILQLVAIAMPFYMQLVVDQVLVNRDTDLLTTLAAGFLGLCLFSIATRAIRGWTGIYLANRLSFTLGTRLFHHLLALPAGFFMKRQMGDLVSRFGSLRPIQDFLANSSIALLLDGLMAVTTLTVMCLYSASLSAVALAFLAASIAVQFLFYAPLRRCHLENITAEAKAETNFMESIRSIGAIKRFGVEPARCNEWQNRFADSINTRVRLGRISLGLDLIQGGLSGAGNVMVIWLGANQVLGGHLSIGMLYAFIAWRSHLTGAVSSLIDALVKYLMLSLHLERVADISETDREDRGTDGNHAPVEGHIAVVDGAFRYSPREPWIFRHLNLRVGAGDSLAIIGPSGCGKSTLLAAMMSVVGLEEGELLIDHDKASVFGIARLRRHCASVMQSDTLLSGSIRSNITFGDATPDLVRMQRVARIACIHNDIAALPMGYESLVGEMGAILSAGQVQRILIARALYREPAILFLDEGTAHLDKETETRVMRRLLSMPMTLVFTTHNRGVLSLAEKVLVLGRDGYRLGRPVSVPQKQKRIRNVDWLQEPSTMKPSVS